MYDTNKMTIKLRSGKKKIEKYKVSRRNMKMKFVKQKNERHLITIMTLVKPVLTYNYGTWGLTKAETETLNCIHRKQLRRISPGYRSLTNK